MLGKIRSKWHITRFTEDIYSRDQFQQLVRQERMRADRNHSCFSLALYNVKSDKEKSKLISHIGRIKEDVREIDFIGWYDKQTIGIMLPDTDFDGAVRFSHHFRNNLEDMTYSEDILTYPEAPEHKKKEMMDFSTTIPGWKKVLDKTGSIIGFLVFSPVFLLLPLYIKLVSPGPVFYSQIRIGYKGREFKFWKFRTMHCETTTVTHNDHLKELIHSDIPMTKLDEGYDPRIIPGGRIIRKACLDEIPQIYNIFKGDMSLVGPRPCIPYEAAEYLRWHKYRFDINPGLTGLWQVSGKNKLTFKEMIRLDITYSRNMTLFNDLRIIAATIPAIIIMIWESVLNRLRKTEVRKEHKKAV